jgi:4-aminobutyrate aminotransferase-like enzyme
LESLAREHEALGEVRAAGLFLAVDIVTDGQPDRARAGRIVNDLRTEGVLISATGPLGHVLKIRPPLVFGAEHVAVFLDRLQAVLRRG